MTEVSSSSSSTVSTSTSSCSTSVASSDEGQGTAGVFSNAVFNSLKTIKRNNLRQTSILKVPVKKAVRKTTSTPNTPLSQKPRGVLELVVRKDEVHDVKMELFQLEEEKRETEIDNLSKLILVVPKKEIPSFNIELNRVRDLQKRRFQNSQQSSLQQPSQTTLPSSQEVEDSTPIRIDIPEGVNSWDWLRPATCYRFFTNSDMDPRLVQQYPHPKPTPHIQMLETWNIRKIVCYSTMISIAGKIGARVCAGKWFQRRRSTWLGSTAAALVVTSLVGAQLTDVKVVEEEEEQHVGEEEVQQPSQRSEHEPNSQHQKENESQPSQESEPPEYWLGLRRIPAHLCKESIRMLFSAPHRMVIDVHMWPPQESGSYAAVQFSSSENVSECIDNLWVVDGVSVIEVVDCCGELYKRFEEQHVYSKKLF